MQVLQHSMSHVSNQHQSYTVSYNTKSD